MVFFDEEQKAASELWSQGKRLFTGGRPFADETDFLAKKMGQTISFTHIATNKKVDFKALVTSYNDTFTPHWKPEAGYGRMDDIQIYSKTTRTVNIGFKVIAASSKEAQANLKNLSAFAHIMYPTVDMGGGATTIKSAPLIKMKFMNWAQDVTDGKGLLGAIKGFSFAPTMEPGVFQEKVHGVWKIYPKEVLVNCQLTVIHEHDLGWLKQEWETKEQVKDKGWPAGYTKKTKSTAFIPMQHNFPYGEYVSPTISTVVGITKNPAAAASKTATITEGGADNGLGVEKASAARREGLAKAYKDRKRKEELGRTLVAYSKHAMTTAEQREFTSLGGVISGDPNTPMPYDKKTGAPTAPATPSAQLSGHAAHQVNQILRGMGIDPVTPVVRQGKTGMAHDLIGSEHGYGDED